MGLESWEEHVDELLAAFDRWASNDRADAAALARSRERWLRQQASEEATLAGSLLELSEAGVGVVLATPSARLHGLIAAVGSDCCLLVEPAGPRLVPNDRLVSVTPAAGPRRNTPTGARPPTLSLSFLDALTTLAADRSPVTLTLTGGSRANGELNSVTADHLQLRADGAGARLTLVALPFVEVCGLE